MTKTFPPHLRLMVDFCCDRYGCGHHVDGHGYGETCHVPGCDCTGWRDHVGCTHRDEPADLMRTALDLIGTTCANYTGNSRCTDDAAARSPYSRYSAERWCDQCIARTALEGTQFPPRLPS